MLVVGGQAGAGAGFNAVPGSAWFSIDRRFNPEEDLGRELARLTDTITVTAEAIGAQVEIEVLQEQPSASTDASHPAAAALVSCVSAVEGSPPELQMCPGVLELAGTPSLGSRRSPTAAAGSTSRTGPRSTSTRGRCAAAPPSTRSSPAPSSALQLDLDEDRFAVSPSPRALSSRYAASSCA